MDKKNKPADELKPKIKEMDSVIKPVKGGEPIAPAPEETAEDENVISLDFSNPLEEVYDVLLKEGVMSMEQMLFHEQLGEIEDLVIRIKILVRQGNVERFKEGRVVKFKAVPGEE